MEEKYYENHLFQDIKLSNEELEFYEFIDCTFTGCTLEDCTLVKCSHFSFPEVVQLLGGLDIIID